MSELMQAEVTELTTPALKYDYDQIAIGHRERVIRAAQTIREAGHVARKNLILVGKELIEVKKRVDHGQFGEWLRTEFDMSDRSARNFMSVAKLYGDSENGNISVLSDTVLYLLAAPSTPEEARQEIEQAAATQYVTVEFAKEAIRKHRPEQPNYAKAWELERMVRTWMDSTIAGDDWDIILDTIRGGKSDYRYDKFTGSLKAAGVAYRQSDLTQAINNVRDQRRQAKLQASARAVYVEPVKEAEPDPAPAPLPMTTRDNAPVWADNRTASEKRISWLVHTPAHDINFKCALDEATVEEMAVAIEQLNAIPQTKTAREKIGARLRKLERDAESHRFMSVAEWNEKASQSTPLDGLRPVKHDQRLTSMTIVGALIDPDVSTTTTSPDSLHAAVKAATAEQLTEALELMPADLRKGRGPVLEAALRKLGQAVAESAERARRVREDLELPDDRLTDAQTLIDMLTAARDNCREDYARLTGKDTDLLPLERAIEPMIERLESLIATLRSARLPVPLATIPAAEPGANTESKKEEEE